MTASSSSGRLLLLFLCPVGFDPKTAWLVSGFSMLATARAKDKFVFSFPKPDAAFQVAPPYRRWAAGRPPYI